MRYEYRNAQRTIIAAIGEDGHIVIVEPGHRLWPEALAAGPVPWVPPEPEPDPVPETVSRFQARAALLDAGLLGAVEVALADAGPLAQLAWAEAVEFRRTSPTIAALSAAIGLTDEQVDSLFRAAAQIEA